MAVFEDNNHISLIIPVPILKKYLVLIMLPLILYLQGNVFAQDRSDEQKEKPKAKVLNLYDKQIGSVDSAGKVNNLYGKFLGSVDDSGIILNVSGIVIGKVESDGRILNQSGTALGTVNRNGEIHNVSMRKIGSVVGVEDIRLIGAAARLLFLK